jgi:hypothetical protein
VVRPADEGAAGLVPEEFAQFAEAVVRRYVLNEQARKVTVADTILA